MGTTRAGAGSHPGARRKSMGTLVLADIPASHHSMGRSFPAHVPVRVRKQFSLQAGYAAVQAASHMHMG